MDFPKLLKRWSGRWGSNPRRPAWEIGQSFVFNNINAHGVDSGHEKRQQNNSVGADGAGEHDDLALWMGRKGRIGEQRKRLPGI